MRGQHVVVYVEDNPVNTLLMEAVVDMRPHLRLLTFADGASALADAPAEPPGLLLIDLSLPDIDGIALLRRLRAEAGFQLVPAIAVSAMTLSEDMAHAQASGFDGYWTKPINVTKVLAELDAMLGVARIW